MSVSRTTCAQWIAEFQVAKFRLTEICDAPSQCCCSAGTRRCSGSSFATTPNNTRGRAMSKRVADVLVETLQAAGVKRCYGIVGDPLNRITHAIRERKIEGS